MKYSGGQIVTNRDGKHLMRTPPSPSSQQQIVGFIGWVLLCFAASALGAIASIQAKTFYASLTQPTWAPPGWVFGPVWSTLFALMAISAWLVWRDGGFAQHRNALLLFIFQLVPNVLWSWLFFTWHKGGLALADLVVLWVLIVATIVSFWRIHKVAAVLLMPYLLWVSFAGFLNYSVWQLNPALLG